MIVTALEPKTLLQNSRCLVSRRQLGAFYTPTELTDILCEWGIRGSKDRILEPCFGGCTFLDSSALTLRKRGQSTPEKYLFGCDIDPVAFEYLHNSLGLSPTSEQFLKIDFLRLFPSTFGNKRFDAVIGNPPYIRSSQFNPEQRDAITDWRANSLVTLNKKASLWAYFLIHAMSFLKRGGRVAWVLPGSFLTSDYSKNLHAYLQSNFGRILAISVRERLFINEGTEERSVILLAEDFKPEQLASGIGICHCDDVGQVRQTIEMWNRNADATEIITDSVGMSVIPDAARRALTTLSLRSDVPRVGDLAAVKIGMVTGDNRYFVRRKREWETAGVPVKHLKPILPRMGWMSGIELSSSHCDQLIRDEVPCLMLDTTPENWEPGLIEFLNEYPQNKIASNATFRKRKIWHCIDYSGIPDAFLAYITHFGPRIVVNTAGVNATNSVYRVYFHPETDSERIKLATIAINSTVSQLWSEGVGRGCGSGGLKLEPREVLKIGLPMPEGIPTVDINDQFTIIDQLMREKRHEEARHAADNFLFDYMGKDAIESLPLLEEGLIVARSRRMRPML